MEEVKEIPLEPDSDEISASEVEDVEEVEESEADLTSFEIERRERKLRINLYRSLGIALLVLVLIASVLTIITYFYHPGETNQVTLQIERAAGYTLIGINSLVGVILLLGARQLKKEEEYILEPVAGVPNDQDFQVEKED